MKGNLVVYLIHHLRALWHQPIIALVVGTMVVWVLENYYTTLLNAHGRWSLVTLALIVITIVLLWWAGQALWRRFGPQPKILLGFPPAPHAGVVLLFSKGVTVTKAVAHHQHRLRYLCLIVTDESLAGARTWVQEMQDTGLLSSIQVREAHIVGAWDPDEVALAVSRAIRQGEDLGLTKADLICDVTGGTKAMTTGAVLACLAEGLLVQMVPAQYDEALKVLRPGEVIQLQLT